MQNTSLLYCALLCVVFLIFNLKKVGLKNKTFILPSTFFAIMWALTSLGGFLLSNGLIGDSFILQNATHLQEIGEYQFMIMLSVFAAFIVVHSKYSSISLYVPFSYCKDIFPRIRRKMRWILLLFFIFGMIRLIMVLSVTGLDYQAMRALYVSGVWNSSPLTIRFQQVCGYLMQLSVFYVCLLGIESGAKGIDYRQVFIDFILFCPYQMSMGGRLFVLSFFVPFIFAYLLVVFASDMPLNLKSRRISKFSILAVIPFVLLIVFQILKQGKNVDSESFKEFSTEIFYTSSSYITIHEFLNDLPPGFSLEYGRNCLGLGSTVYSSIIEGWVETHNSALVCTPSIIPEMYLDFGKWGSLIVYFFLFYYIEKYAFKCLQRQDLKGIFLFVLLCMTAYSTVSGSVSGNIKAFIVGYILVTIITRSVRKIV